MSRRVAAVLVLVSCVGALAGCGVRAEDVARPLSSGDVPSVPSTAQPSPTGSQTQVLYLLGPDDSKLVPVKRPATSLSPTSVLQALQSGATKADSLKGLTSALPAEPIVTDLRMVGGVAVLGTRLPDETNQNRNDPFKAFGQIVLTLTKLPTVTAVRFLQKDGRPLAVPLGDGQLPANPRQDLTAADYQDLLGNAAQATATVRSSRSGARPGPAPTSTR